MIPSEYIDQFGLVAPAAGQKQSDNGTLFTVQAILLQIVNVYVFSQALDKCFNEDGLPLRYPGSLDQNSPDNILTFSLVAPNAIVDYGSKHWWFFSPDGKLTLRSWMGRQPGLVGMAKHMAGHWSPFGRFAWNVGVYLTMVSKQRDQNGNLETSDRLLVETTLLSKLGSKFTYSWLQKVWRERINQDFLVASQFLEGKTGLDEMVYLYFGDKHPFYGVWK